MRTSRISRHTAKVVAATRAQPSRRQTRSGAAAAVQGFALNTVEAASVALRPRESDPALLDSLQQSGSAPSSVPGDSGSEGDGAVVNRKRKRGQDAPTATAVKRETAEVSMAAVPSPAKAKAKKKPPKARRAPAKKVVTSDGHVKVEPPPNWEEMYTLTRQMRNENVAPVDTMGCESLADRSASPRDQRFQTLVSLMLSSQTKDTVTAVAIKGMQDRMPGGFNLESVLAIEPTALNAFICKVGFHNLKTKYIKSAAEILRDKWQSDIPDTIEGLTSLPGVGPKMAYLCMSAAWGRHEGIGVDVHVHRITNLWGWNDTKQPEQTRAALQAWLPKDRWHDINNLLVGFGQTICLPVGRKCGDCRLADRGLCPSAIVGKKTAVKKEVTLVKADGADGRSIKLEHVEEVKEKEVKKEDVENIVSDIEDVIPNIEGPGRDSYRRPLRTRM